MGARIQVIRTGTEKLFIDRLPPKTQRAFTDVSHAVFLRGTRWYLAGGTALALHVGHRKSVDLDFFTPAARFDETAWERELFATKKWKTTLRDRGTIYGTYLDAKMSFIAYPFFLPSPQRLAYGSARILMPSDIATMKIIAISQRGRKRDFVDLYWYCRNREPLEEIIVRSMKQYPGQENNLPHILKSLTYFENANEDVMPALYFNADWWTVKAYFRREVPRLTREYFGIR